jgi:hypothetical protein
MRDKLLQSAFVIGCACCILVLATSLVIGASDHWYVRLIHVFLLMLLSGVFAIWLCT